MKNWADQLVCRLLLLALLFHGHVSAGGAKCTDIDGLLHETGYHYIPGPEPCTLCVCDDGNPTLCKVVFCKFKNPDCKTFRYGNNCCEFICLDDMKLTNN